MEDGDPTDMYHRGLMLVAKAEAQGDDPRMQKSKKKKKKTSRKLL